MSVCRGKREVGRYWYRRNMRTDYCMTDSTPCSTRELSVPAARRDAQHGICALWHCHWCDDRMSCDLCVAGMVMNGAWGMGAVRILQAPESAHKLRYS